jgi:ATP-dependent helicase/nuclease subunit A
LYVAATRAKDRLVLPFIDGKAERRDADPGPKCLNDWLREAGAHEEPTVDIDALPSFDAELPVWRTPHVGAGAAAGAGRIVDERAAWIDEHDALVEAGSAPLRVLTATALKPEWERAMQGDDGVRRGRAADFGSAVHALLERSMLRRDRLDPLAAAVAAEHGMAERAGEIRRVAAKALESAVVARALRSSRMLLEAPFTALAGGDGLAEGRIDLLFEEGGGIVIVDFKTDAVSAAEVEERTEFYRNQALIYAWAVRRATKTPVREVVFLYARAGVEQTMVVDDAFIAEAETLVAE